MLIRELEKNTGLERATIRFYEKEGLITPVRQENGYREYSSEDCNTLLKIKLLRQLGMPLEMIRELQRGREDFSAALDGQILALEHQIQDAGRAKEICAALRDSGATFEALDAAHYLHELTRVRPAEPDWTPQPVPEFRQKPLTHPWRRLFARTIDYALLNGAIRFLLIVILRIRPVNGLIYTIFGCAIVTCLLWIPFEGIMLHFWGTTPGKWVMGIQMESVNGGKLSISAAMHRAWDVLRYGCGFTVPVYEQWRLYQSHKEYMEFGDIQWDLEWDAEIRFHYYYETRKKILIAVLAAGYVLVCGLTLNDSMKPVNRGDDLTVAQIAENYNDYLEALVDGETPPSDMYLTETGQWYAAAQNQTGIVIGSTAVDGYANYRYEVEDGYVRSITYEQSWTDVFYLMPIGDRVQYTVLAVAGAQDWATLPRILEFAELLSEELAQEKGQLVFENLEISWTVETENCLYTSSGLYFAKDGNAPSSVHLRFKLTIHETQ